MNWIALCLSVVLLSLADAGFGQAPEELLQQSFLFGKAPAVQMRITMETYRGDSSKRREIEVFIKRQEKAYKMLLHIVYPAFLNQMKFLSHKAEDGNESKWLKTSSGVKKLAEQDRSERIFDSDLTVEDLSAVKVADYQLTLVGQLETDSGLCYAIEAVPRLRGSLYRKKVVFVEKETGLPRAVEYYGEGSELMKRLQIVSIQTIGGITFPLLCRIDSYDSATYTIVRFHEIRVVDDLPDKVFNKGAL